MIQGITFDAKSVPWFTWLILALSVMFISIGIAFSFYWGYSTITYKKIPGVEKTGAVLP